MLLNAAPGSDDFCQSFANLYPAQTEFVDHNDTTCLLLTPDSCKQTGYTLVQSVDSAFTACDASTSNAVVSFLTAIASGALAASCIQLACTGKT